MPPLIKHSPRRTIQEKEGSDGWRNTFQDDVYLNRLRDPFFLPFRRLGFLNAHLAQSLSLSIWLAKARFEQLPPLTSLAAHPPLLTRLAWPTRSAIISFKVPCSRIVNECDHRAHDISKNILKCHSMLSPDLALRHCIAAPLATALPLAAASHGSGGSLAAARLHLCRSFECASIC